MKEADRSTTSSMRVSRRPSSRGRSIALLARMPPLLRERGAPHHLIVSTNYDLGLERAFEDAGEERHRRLCRDGNPSRTLLAPPTGPGPRPIDVPNTYAAELSLERRTILLKLHGAVDPLPNASGRASSRRTTTSTTSAAPSSRRSSPYRSQRSWRSHFLFLGYDMADWNLRLNRIWASVPSRTGPGRSSVAEPAGSSVLASIRRDAARRGAGRVCRAARTEDGERSVSSAPSSPFRA